MKEVLSFEERLELVFLDIHSKSIDDVRVFFESEVTSTVDIGKDSKITLKMHSDSQIEHIDWDVQLFIYDGDKLLFSKIMSEKILAKPAISTSSKKYLRIFESNLSLKNLGKYVVKIEACAIDSNKEKIIHRNTDYITVVEPPSIEFTGEIIDSLVDDNNNGLADKLRIILPFSGKIKHNEKYVIQAQIGNAQYDGKWGVEETKGLSIEGKRVKRVSQSLNAIAIGVGVVDSSETAVEIEFKGRKIAEKHKNGKLKIINVSIRPFNMSGTKRVEKIPLLGETKSYSYKEFERELITVHQQEADISLVDEDLDGIYEGLNISFDVSVELDSKYEARMLFGEQVDYFFEIKEYFELSEGKHEINIFIPAQRLVNAKANGEVLLANFHFRDANTYDWPTQTRWEFGVTPHFQCEDFGDCTVRLPKPKKSIQGNYQ